MNRTVLAYGFIILVGALLFIPFLGHVHLFDWDEINFAECAREMIVSKDYLRVQIDFQPFWEKPPLFIWLQVLSMKAFGINEFAARFPNAIAGIATLCTLYYAGRRVATELIAQWWVILYIATWLPHFYFKTGIIDPVFNLFIFIAFLQVYLVKWGSRPMLHAALSGIFLGLAVLTKGPAAVLIAGLAFGVYLVLNRGLGGYKIKHLLIVGLLAVLVTASWFGVEILSHGWALIREFIDYQAGLVTQNIADHEEPWYYHPLVLLIGCFPASLFLFQYRRHQASEAPDTRAFTQWMWILFWVVLILFSIVKTKIVHYSSMCYFPLTFLAAVQIQRLWHEKGKLRSWLPYAFGIIGGLLGLLITLLPVIGMHKERLIPMMHDAFAVGNLRADVPWNWTECIWGAIYLTGLVWSLVLMRKNFKRAIVILASVQIIIIQITMTHFTPKIEGYSQRAAIDFFSSLKGKDVYVQVLGYKSYAHLFYSAKLPSQNPMYYGREATVTKKGDTLYSFTPNEGWLLNGPIDKPAYFVCKVGDADDWRKVGTLEEIGVKNGFVFFKRKDN